MPQTEYTIHDTVEYRTYDPHTAESFSKAGFIVTAVTA